MIRLLEFVRSGDEIVIHDFSRLARNTSDLLSIVDDLTHRGIKLYSIKENLDTTTATGKLMLTMLGAIYEFERSMLKERQLEGIKIAKENGKYKGRKKIEYPVNWEEVYLKWSNKKISSTDAMAMLNLRKTTFYKLIKHYSEDT